MIKRFLTITLALITLTATAQVQQGVVRTKGRYLSNNTFQKGTPLAGAVVQVKGANKAESKSNGAFSVKLPNERFVLQNVTLKGYQLADAQQLKTYVYSSNPLVLVLETPGDRSADKLNAERKVRRSLEKQLHEREEEIEALKEQNRITEKEYQERLQKLFKDQENSEKLISDMAERFASMDWDALDDFNRQVSELILNGELLRADSLINTKGDINQRIADLKKHQQANAEEAKKLEQSKAMAQKNLEDIAQDCYNKFEIFKAKYQNDSAAHYIELRAALDTTDCQWQIDAGVFIFHLAHGEDKALNYFQTALQNAINQNGEIHPSVATCYHNMAVVYYYIHEYDKALAYHQKALDIFLQVYGKNHPEVAKYYNIIGCIYAIKNEYDNALAYYRKALDIFLQVYGENHPKVAKCYYNQGAVYCDKGEYDKALEYYQKALDIRVKVFGENHLFVESVKQNIEKVKKQLQSSK